MRNANGTRNIICSGVRRSAWLFFVATVKRNHGLDSCAQRPSSQGLCSGCRRIREYRDGRTVLRKPLSRAILTEKKELRAHEVLESENRRSQQEIAKIREMEGRQDGQARPVEIVRFYVASRSADAPLNGSIGKSVLSEQ